MLIKTVQDVPMALRQDLQRAGQTLLNKTIADLAIMRLDDLRRALILHMHATGRGESEGEATREDTREDPPTPPTPNETTDVPSFVPPAADTPTGDLINIPELIRRVTTAVENRIMPQVTDLARKVAANAGESPTAAPTKIVLPDAREMTTDGPAHHLLPTLVQLGLLSRAVNMGVWLGGPAGSGKSFAVQQASRLIGAALQHDGYGFASLTIHRDASIIDIVSFRTASGDYVPTDIVRVAREGGVLFFDEADRVDSVLTAINNLISQREITTPEGTEKLHPNTIIVAATNSDGRGATRQYNGVVAMDASTRNRFFRLMWGYDEALETAMIGETTQAIKAWVTTARRWRQQIADMAEDHRPDVVISPRTLAAGAAWLRAVPETPIETVADALIWHGLPVPHSMA